MREAAYQAGIGCRETPDQVLIALEPEAASVYCRKLKLSQLVPERQRFAFSNSQQEAGSQENALVLDDSGTGNLYHTDNILQKNAKSANLLTRNA